MEFSSLTFNVVGGYTNKSENPYEITHINTHSKMVIKCLKGNSLPQMQSKIWIYCVDDTCVLVTKDN